MKYVGFRIFVLSFFISSVFAGSGGVISSPPTKQTGLFIGLGGSYNFVRINSEMSGTLNAISGFPPTGVFWGTTGDYSNKKQAFAPEGQIGYFRHFKDSNWLWGIDFLYQYSRIKKSADGDVNAPGTYIHFINPSVNVTDEVSINSVETKVNHELMLPVFIGYSLTNSFIYLGAGPSLFRTQHNMAPGSDTHSGFYMGDINGFSNTRWVWGSAVQTGMAFYLNPAWFLKLNYSYAQTGHYNVGNSVPFSPEINGGLNKGIVSFNTSHRLIAQEVAVSINRLFAL